MFELYKKELTTPGAIISKLEEIKKQYNNYIKLSKNFLKSNETHINTTI